MKDTSINLKVLRVAFPQYHSVKASGKEIFTERHGVLPETS